MKLYAKKLFSVLLAICMLVGIFSTAAFVGAVQSDAKTVYLHAANASPRPRVSVGDTLRGYRVTRVDSDGSVTLDVSGLESLSNFFLPYVEEIWYATGRYDTYVTVTGYAAVQKNPGGSFQLGHGKNTAYYYGITPTPASAENPGAGTSGGSGGTVIGNGSGRFYVSATLVYHSNYPNGKDYTVSYKYSGNCLTSIYNVFDIQRSYSTVGFSFPEYTGTGKWYKARGTDDDGQWNGTGTGGQWGSNIGLENGKTYHLYAAWTPNDPPPPTYAVLTYFGNGNTGGEEPPSQTELRGTNVTIADAGTLVRDGYVFKGWSKDPEATSADWVPEDTMKLDEDTILYAVWEPITAGYTVQWVDEEGNALKAADNRTGTIGKTVSATAADTVISGYTYLPAPSTASATLAASGTVLTLVFKKDTPTTTSSSNSTTPSSNPTTPSSNPTTPSTASTTLPTTPSTASTTLPTTPSSNPTTPGTNPTTPSTASTTLPTMPGTNPTTPGTNPTTPGTNPTTPGTNPTTPGTNPTVPGNPTTPTVPGIEEIDDPETPLAPGTETNQNGDPVKGETPVPDANGGSGDTMTPPDDEIIDDDNPPLSDSPKTGDNGAATAAAFGAGIALGGLILSRKRGKTEAEA